MGEEASVFAYYEDREAKLNISIIPEPSMGGVIRDIRFSPLESKEVCLFHEDKGILEIYYKHPLVKKYMSKKNYRNRPDFLVFIADHLTLTSLEAIIRTGVKINSSRFPIFNQNNPEVDIKRHLQDEYFKNGPKLHDLFTKLIKSLKISSS